MLHIIIFIFLFSDHLDFYCFYSCLPTFSLCQVFIALNLFFIIITLLTLTSVIRKYSYIASVAIFIFEVFLRYYCHIVLYKFRVYSMMILLTYIRK